MGAYSLFCPLLLQIVLQIFHKLNYNSLFNMQIAIVYGELDYKNWSML